MEYKYCETCLWFGAKDALKLVPLGGALTATECPNCNSEDVFTLRLFRCAQCNATAMQEKFFPGEHLDHEHPVTDLRLMPERFVGACDSTIAIEVTQQVFEGEPDWIKKMLNGRRDAHVARWRDEQRRREDFDY